MTMTTTNNKPLTIFVKGNEMDLRRGAKERGINILRMVPSSLSRESVAEVSEQDAMKVIEWFCEKGICQPGFGYKEGTLLFWT